MVIVPRKEGGEGGSQISGASSLRDGRKMFGSLRRKHRERLDGGK